MNNKLFTLAISSLVISLSACNPTPYEARKIENAELGTVEGAALGAATGVGIAAVSGGALGTGAWMGAAVGAPVGLVAGVVATDIAIENELNDTDEFIAARGQAIADHQRQVTALRAESDADSYEVNLDDSRARYQYLGPALGIPTRHGVR